MTIFNHFFLFCLLFVFASSCSEGGDDTHAGTLQGSLTLADSKDSMGFNYDKINLGFVKKGQTVTVSIVPDGFDAVLYLVETDDNTDSTYYYKLGHLTFSDDVGSDEVESFSYTSLYGSKMTIYISSYDAGETGHYLLDYTVDAEE